MMTMSEEKSLLDYVACPQCGGDLTEDDDGCIECTDCDFQDCEETEEEE